MFCFVFLVKLKSRGKPKLSWKFYTIFSKESLIVYFSKETECGAAGSKLGGGVKKLHSIFLD